MDWKSKVNAVVLSFLVFMAVASATVYYVKTAEEAYAALQQNVSVSFGKCYAVDEPYKIPAPDMELKDIQALPYSLDVRLQYCLTNPGGSKNCTVTNGVALTNNISEAGLKAAMDVECEGLEGKINSQFGQAPTVIVRPDPTGILDWVRDAAGVWSSKPPDFRP